MGNSTYSLHSCQPGYVLGAILEEKPGPFKNEKPPESGAFRFAINPKNY